MPGKVASPRSGTNQTNGSFLPLRPEARHSEFGQVLTISRATKRSLAIDAVSAARSATPLPSRALCSCRLRGERFAHFTRHAPWGVSSRADGDGQLGYWTTPRRTKGSNRKSGPRRNTHHL